MQITKRVDSQGRIVIPKKWRDKHLKDHTVILELADDKIIVKSFEVEDITELFDSVDLDIKSDLSDWDNIKRELIEIR